MPLIRLENITKEYLLGKETVQALKHVTLNIDDGVFLAIAGPSGSGKTTLLNLIGCIDTPTTGNIFIDGYDVGGKTPDELAELRARSIGFVFATVISVSTRGFVENDRRRPRWREGKPRWCPFGSG